MFVHVPAKNILSPKWQIHLRQFSGLIKVQFWEFLWCRQWTVLDFKHSKPLMLHHALANSADTLNCRWERFILSLVVAELVIRLSPEKAKLCGSLNTVGSDSQHATSNFKKMDMDDGLGTFVMIAGIMFGVFVLITVCIFAAAFYSRRKRQAMFSSKFRVSTLKTMT